MKPKKEKYEEAVERNLKGFASKWKGKKLTKEEIYMKLGIRKGDDQFDAQVDAIKL
ncbi:MAG: hypothetical protein GF411_18930 [Candidatus Lokiarchaeota archaeon]|nr:hypothetical protein [Candidatus Lokiarchaeota archaeon]